MIDFSNIVLLVNEENKNIINNFESFNIKKDISYYEKVLNIKEFNIDANISSLDEESTLNVFEFLYNIEQSYYGNLFKNNNYIKNNNCLVVDNYNYYLKLIEKFNSIIESDIFKSNIKNVFMCFKKNMKNFLICTTKNLNFNIDYKSYNIYFNIFTLMEDILNNKIESKKDILFFINNDESFIKNIKFFLNSIIEYLTTNEFVDNIYFIHNSDKVSDCFNEKLEVINNKYIFFHRNNIIDFILVKE